MALAMPGPSIRLRTGVFHFNVRIPSDLCDKIRATRIALPFEHDQYVSIVATDKVAFSLRTKDHAVSRARFTPAYAALVRHFDAVRAGPKPLTHKQLVALAGDVYRRWVERYESDSELTPEWLADEWRRMDADVEGWMTEPSDNIGPIRREGAELMARLAQPNGPYLTAFTLNSDIAVHGLSIRLEEAHEFLFGADVDRLCAERYLMLDVATRLSLLREVAQAVRFAAKKLIRNLEGDYSPDPAATRFPAYEAPTPEARRVREKTVKTETVGELFERWKVFATEIAAPSTLRRYGPSLASLDRWWKHRDWRTLTDEDVFAWAKYRRDVDDISPSTVNRNDLVAVSSVLAWPTTLAGGKLTASNPAIGVKLPKPAKQTKREKTFREAEIREILKAARAVKLDPHFPRASASRRWCPWLCAYSGARVQETLWLEKAHIWQEGDTWVMHFTQTKDGNARVVPIHEQLIKEGFLDFVASAPAGLLFVGDREQKPNATRTPQELRAAELTVWLRSKVKLDKDLSPNHAWRHTWITYAEASGIPKRFSNRITGHNMNDASDRYVAGLTSLLAEQMAKFPVYAID